MKLGRINAWPAFADMVFVLFVCTLLGAAHYRGQVAENEEAKRLAQEFRAANPDLVDDNASLAETIEVMKKQLEKGRKECGIAKPLIDGIRNCLSGQGIEQSNQTDDLPCEVEVGATDGLVFKSNGDVVSCRRQTGTDISGEPKYDKNRCSGNEWKNPEAKAIALKISECVVDQSYKFLREDQQAFDQIKSIFVDGYTDCKGTNEGNWVIGAVRATALAKLMRLEVDRLENVSNVNQTLLKQKLNVRSFGENKQTTDPQCVDGNVDGKEQTTATKTLNRRVTISIEQKVTAIGAAAAQ